MCRMEAEHVSAETTAVPDENPTPMSSRTRFQTALILAAVADALQVILLPLFVEGALSPLDDLLDFIVAAVLVRLLGWHWEFLPSLLGELIPGVDLVPFWTLAVANVYRKSRLQQHEPETDRDQHSLLKLPHPLR